MPGVWARFDSGYYLAISTEGYAPRSDAVNFFPLYPLLVRAFAMGNPSLVGWAGVALSTTSYVLAMLVLFGTLERSYGAACATASILSISVFPTAFFFSAIYTEGLFLLLSVLVYWATENHRLALAAIFVSLASLTRINGILLATIPLSYSLFDGSHPKWCDVARTFILSVLGLTVYSLCLWRTNGDPLAFITSQHQTMERSTTWPGVSLVHSFGVILWGAGGLQNNWFMRVLSIQDSFALLLFCILSTLGIRSLRNMGLACYLVVATVFLLSSTAPTLWAHTQWPDMSWFCFPDSLLPLYTYSSIHV